MFNYLFLVLPLLIFLQQIDLVSFAEKFGLPIAILIPVILWLKNQAEKKDGKLFDLLIEQNNYLKSLLNENSETSRKQNSILEEISEDVKSLHNFKCQNFNPKEK